MVPQQTETAKTQLVRMLNKGSHLPSPAGHTPSKHVVSTTSLPEESRAIEVDNTHDLRDYPQWQS